jgi:ABC-type antimicrobial peptide transport system permease subunit
MSRNPDILATSGSVHHVGKGHAAVILHFPDREYEADQVSVGPGYFETMGIELKEGRSFNELEGSDRRSVIVNETLVKNMGWSEPTGQVFKIDSIQYEVIGVVKDFHSYNFDKLVRPLIFRTADKEDYRYLSMKVRPGAELKTYKALQAEWAGLFPEVPFVGGYQQDVWGGYLEFVQVHGRVWRVIAGIAVALATLGLYGLMTLNIAGRVREFSIRKVLGAGVTNIASLITRQYVVLFGIALTISAPAGYFLSQFVLEVAYTYHMQIDYSGAIVGTILLVLVLLTTLATQVRKVSKDNVVEGLKVE